MYRVLSVREIKLILLLFLTKRILCAKETAQELQKKIEAETAALEKLEKEIEDTQTMMDNILLSNPHRGDLLRVDELRQSWDIMDNEKDRYKDNIQLWKKQLQKLSQQKDDGTIGSDTSASTKKAKTPRKKKKT